MYSITSTRSMLVKRTLLSSLIASCLILTACNNDGSDSSNSALLVPTQHLSKHSEELRTAKMNTFYSAMQTLWSQHMEWTYATITAFVNNSPTFDASVARLLKNQEDIGNAIKLYYGNAAGEKLTALLKDHILDVAEVLKAVKANDADAQKKALDATYQNAQEIADFLADANPNWSRQELRDMMKGHIDTTVTYTVAQFKGDYAGSIAAYDQAEHHMIHMSNMLGAGIINQFPAQFQKTEGEKLTTPSTNNLHIDMQKFWMQHMKWTYATITAFVNNAPTFDASVARLLKNQEDIGNAIKPYYGNAAGDQLTALLKDHILDVAEVLKAVKANDADAQKKALDATYQNAQEIADFLADANPNWSRQELRDMMKGHIDTTVTYTVAQFKGDYAGSITAYDQAEHHMLMMSDLLSNGLVEAFPLQFKN